MRQKSASRGNYKEKHGLKVAGVKRKVPLKENCLWWRYVPDSFVLVA
jgi:hypothetical protein